MAWHPARAVEPANVVFEGASRDLLPYFVRVETDQRDAVIEKPGSATGVGDFMTLRAKGQGPQFRWIVAGLTNGSDRPKTTVIAIADQGFVGSRLMWPKPSGATVVNLATEGAISVEPQPSPGRQAYAVTLDPGKTAVIGFEISGAIPSVVTLWQRDAFQEQKDYFAFFRGAMLGIAALLSAAMLALYGFRARPVFLAAGGFGLSALAFMTLEAGHLMPIVTSLGIEALTPAAIRALVEGLMAAFLILYLVTVGELRHLLPIIGNLLLLIGLLAFAIPVYGFADPITAAGIARMVFGATAALGFGLIYYLWRRGEAKAETALVAWSAVLLWTFLAFAAALADAHSTVLSPLLLAGLCTVLVVMGFTLAHQAFSQGYLSRHFFREAGRRALALAGARAYVWDWQVEDGDLHVGAEIEAALDLPAGLLAEAGVEGFLEIMHPSDRASYLAAVEAAELQGNGVIEREFRLRHGDGGYRWFQLRGRAMPGHGRRALRCIGTLTDVTNAKRVEERLLTDAVYDRVTGLPNRALFVDRLTRAVAAAEAGSPASPYVLLIDIDRFKTVNNGLGHEAGDALLTIVGRRLTAEMGANDTVARMPGDQFAVLFVGGEPNRDIAVFSDGLRKAVARPIDVERQEVFLTASIGVAPFREAALSADQMLKDAALALYEAKRRGTDTIEVFRASLRDDRAELVVLEAELRRAIERSEIEVHYQPIARLADMNLAGFEALVRWRHPVLGLLAPESFLALAEQTGMIRDIGRTVLNEAGRQLGIWQRAYRPAEPIFVAVNISSAQLIEADLIDDFKQLIQRENVARGSLKIEVTESLVMQYPERAGRILERLREMGVGLACDDFGTGYSSLASLRQLPFDTLKVDRSFIDVEARDSRAGTILEAIIAMAHALGLAIVAEGIENQEQVDRLGALSCDLGQGYFIGRPMTARQVSDALSGLPYAASGSRTAITWLWEKAAKDPAPAPLSLDLTAADIDAARSRAAVERARLAAMAPPPVATPTEAAIVAPAVAETAPEEPAPQPEEPAVEAADAALPASDTTEPAGDHPAQAKV
ncbi:MAG: EAL domain-containing protein [Rhizobiales bacterium]|nr:EAL domain-containing protein [Hyphomicrobiales bacterium]